MSGQLFQSDDFLGVEDRIKQFDMTIFRNKARSCGAITFEESTQLGGISMQGQLRHNEILLGYILPSNTEETFRKLTNVVKAMGPRYNDLHLTMLAIMTKYKQSKVPR